MTTPTYAEAMRMALDALEFAAQHTDKLICYGSTALQNPANLVDGKVRAAADALRAALAAPDSLDWQSDKPLASLTAPALPQRNRPVWRRRTALARRGGLGGECAADG